VCNAYIHTPDEQKWEGRGGGLKFTNPSDAYMESTWKSTATIRKVGELEPSRIEVWYTEN